MNISNISFGNNLNVLNVNKPDTQKIRKTPRELLDLPVNYTAGPNYVTNMGKLTPKELFIVQYNSATELSDGSKLIRPVCLSLGKVDIIPSETNRKEYIVTIKSPYQDEPTVKTMTENELLSNKTLCRGKIKPTNEKGKYLISFKDMNDVKKLFVATEKGCLKLLEENMLYM